MFRRQRGFSLIELMVVVVIVGIFAAIAIPNYTQYMTRARRSDAQQLLLDIQNMEQQYLLDARVFTTALDSTGLNMSKDGWTCTAASCSNPYYTVTVTLIAGPPPGYTITADAIGTQAADGDLTLSSTGARTGTW